MSVISFVSELADKFAPLKAAYVEHLDDNLGEILPHILMADYCRVVISAKPEDLWVKMLLSTLEDKFSDTEDDGISNVIAVSFIEHLPPPRDEHLIIRLLGKKLRWQYDFIFGQISPSPKSLSD